jgi:two-component system sensor histidine kinase CiaH
VFTKLKKKFVIINMSLLTVVFIAIFSVIYMLTAAAGERQTEMTLNAIMFAPQRPFPDNPRVATCMIVELDEENHIITKFSFMNMSPETFTEAVVQAIQNKAVSGKIKIGETHYAFLKNKNPYGTKIVFVDRTSQHQTLINLLLVFTIVGGISLFLLLFISIYFANKSIAPIKEAFEKQNQFVADASHELRTPLAVIKTNLALITASGEETVNSQSRWLDYIASQTDRMTNLVNDMLSLARYDFMENKPDFFDFDLSQLVSSTLLSFEAIFFENHITLESEIKPRVFLNGNKESIEKVISILMNNAIKHTPVNGSIFVQLTSKKNKIELKITNTGQEIPPEYLEKIFERFYRLDTARTREDGGYGLGLAIAKSIVEQHQGKIYAQSNPGIGTSFVVEL